MRFSVEYNNPVGYTTFTAEAENEFEKHGVRAQGPYVDISLADNKLELGYVPRYKLHPDIIAAICLTAFYPFIKYSATMPEPVSENFSRALDIEGLPQHEKIDGVYKATHPITINNVDKNLEPYDGDRTVIAFGGGMDSTSVALLYPEFNLIHSSSGGGQVKEFAKNNLPNKCYTIDSNCKELCSPSGFTSFANIFLPPLIMSSDLGIKNICCGEILGASCLSNGHKYYPNFRSHWGTRGQLRGKKRNRWYRFFDEIGLRAFSPVAGCSELITSKIVHRNNLSSEVLFCESSDGRPCYKCTKCFRKMLGLGYSGYSIQKKSWEDYDEREIIDFLKKRPIYFSHIFIETIKNNPDLPSYMRDCIKDIISTETSLFNKIYSESFAYFPREIKDMLIKRLTKYADVMNDEEEKYLENWDMT